MVKRKYTPSALRKPTKKTRLAKSDPDAVVGKKTALEEKFLLSIPRSMVIRTGGSSLGNLRPLVMDVRALMMPWTCENLKESRKNTLKDFLHVTGLLHISHFLTFSVRSSGKVMMKLAYTKGGVGPTYHYLVTSYMLRKDVMVLSGSSSTPLKKPDLSRPPILVLHGFKNIIKSSDGPSTKLLQDLANICAASFPQVEFTDVLLGRAGRRVVIFHHAGKGNLEIRQYAVVWRTQETETEKLLNKSAIGGNATADDLTPEETHKVLSSSNCNLVEVGPRLSLQLVKIVSGIFKGEVLYDSEPSDVVAKDDLSSDGEEIDYGQSNEQ